MDGEIFVSEGASGLAIARDKPCAEWLAEAMAHVLNVPRVVNKNAKAAKQLRERGDVSVEFLKGFVWTKER